MKVVFFGTPDFAVPALKALAERHEVLAAVTQPDKPRGRHGGITPCPVKQTAQELGIKVLQYQKVRTEGVEELKALGADVFVTCAYGQILSKEIIDIPKHGIINIHASLLPKYRGAAPIQWAILDGEEYTGVTIMRTEEGVDTGDILISERIKIGERETAGELFDRLSLLGARLITEALDLVGSGRAVFVPQDHSLATKVRMLKKEDGLIDWSLPSAKIDRIVRAMNPWPSAFTYFNGKLLKIWNVEIFQNSPENLPCGSVVEANAKKGIVVATGDGAICVRELQLEGSRRMTAEEFLLGHPLGKNDVFGRESKC